MQTTNIQTRPKKNPLLFIFILSGIFFLVFLGVVSRMMFSVGGSTKKAALFSSKGDHLGVLEIKGVISDSKKYLEAIERFSEEESIKGVLVRINSPGGAVAPSQEVYDALVRLQGKKPVFSSMGTVAASGGYYIAVGTKKIFANPGTITGSIGVIMPFADMSGLYNWAKVKPYNIKTGKYKDIGNPAREMSAEEKQLVQNMVDNVLLQFRRAVAASRGLAFEDVVAVSDGRILTGDQAKHLKLVDELGGFDQAVSALAKEAGISGKPELVYPKKKTRWMDLLTDSDAEADSLLDLKTLGRQILFSLFGGNTNDRSLGNPNLSGAGLPMFLLPLHVQSSSE
ncbi:MAG: signal peptide peptidase SppA [Bacteriovoracia bacterium]